MSGKLFLRLMAVATCVAAFATSNEAEAGRRHRRQCCEPVCCTPICYEPVCCAPVCCGSAYETVAWYDSCGRLVCRRVACCETIVSSTIVVPATNCCGLASNGSADAGSVAKVPTNESLAATTDSVVK